MIKIDEAVVLHKGWEMDNLAWVIKNEDGSRELRTTSHGSEYKMEMEELDRKIAETENSLIALKRIKGLVLR